jgi:hypothetical protein
MTKSLKLVGVIDGCTIVCMCVTCVCVLHVYLIGLVKENKLIQMHGISNLKIKNTGCCMSLTYATSIHYYPLTHTNAYTH